MSRAEHLMVEFNIDLLHFVPSYTVYCIWKTNSSIWVAYFNPDALLIIGTEADCSIFVPVCPKLASVFPHPAMVPFLPIRLIGKFGKHIGWMWFLEGFFFFSNYSQIWRTEKYTHESPAGFVSFKRAISYRSGWVIRNWNLGWIIFCVTLCFSAGKGSSMYPEFWVSSSPKNTDMSCSLALWMQCAAVAT